MDSLRQSAAHRADERTHRGQSVAGRAADHPSWPEGSAADADARRDRRGLWRYRNLADLHDEGELFEAAPARGRPAARVWRAEPDLLVADADRDDQICRRRDARRQ